MNNRVTPHGGHRMAAGMVAMLLVLLSTFVATQPARAATTTTTTATGSCPTDYNGSTVPCSTSTTTPSSSSTTTPSSSSTTFTLVLTADAVLINGTTVEIRWKVCIEPPSAVADAGANLAVQFIVDHIPVDILGGSGVILSDGSGCTTDPDYYGCLNPGPHSAVATVQGLGTTNVADFVVPDGVSCTASAVGSSGTTGTSTTTSSGGGSLAFTGTNILRMVLAGLILLLLGGVITYVARERRRSRSN